MNNVAQDVNTTAVTPVPAQGLNADDAINREYALAEYKNALDRTTKYETNARGAIVKVVDPTGLTVTLDRDFAGNVTQVIDGLGYATRYRTQQNGCVWVFSVTS